MKASYLPLSHMVHPQAYCIELMPFWLYLNRRYYES